MKKRRIIGLTLLCIAAVLAVAVLFCTPDYGIRMSLSDVSRTGASVVCTRIPSVGSVITGSSYFLERYTDKGWVPVPELPKDHEVAWTMEAYPIRPGVMTFRKNWEWLYGSLPAGTYRLGKRFIRERKLSDNEYLTLYAQFQIGS